jgi:hypothetical protein
MRSRELMVVLLLLTCAAGCKAASSNHGTKPSNTGKKGSAGSGTATGGGQSNADQDGSSASGSGGSSSGNGSGGASGGHASGSGGDGSSHMQQSGSGGSTSMTAGDGGVTIEQDAAVVDAGPGFLGTGSCCMEHDTPGCSNADLQVCVCEKLTACCTDAWSAPCVLIVQQKYCQPGVRDCVCGDGDGQWGRHSCCDQDWSDAFCNDVAQSKCGAMTGCL